MSSFAAAAAASLRNNDTDKLLILAILISTFGNKSLTKHVHDSVGDVFSHWLFNFLTLSAVVYIATKDILLSLITATAIAVLFEGIVNTGLLPGSGVKTE